MSYLIGFYEGSWNFILTGPQKQVQYPGYNYLENATSDNFDESQFRS